jgi:hypothetical protein
VEERTPVMRLPRAVLGALVWILAAVVGLLGALLSVTVIGLPLGIPLLLGARRLFQAAVRMMLPSHLAHPVQETKTSGRKKGKEATEKGKRATKKGRKTGKELSRRSSKAVKQASSAVPEPSGLRKKAKKRAKKKSKRLRKALR